MDFPENIRIIEKISRKFQENKEDKKYHRENNTEGM